MKKQFRSIIRIGYVCIAIAVVMVVLAQTNTLSFALPSLATNHEILGMKSESAGVEDKIPPAPPMPVILKSNGIETGYASIQSAIDASVAGDTVSVSAGTYVEQLVITRGITLLGADSATTIIRSPLVADLVQSGGNWKNLKNQDVFAVIGVKTGDASQVVIKNLQVDGYNQGTLNQYTDHNTYTFCGIFSCNSNTTVDGVLITRARSLYSDYGSTLPTGYSPEDQPAGMNHNEGILAEGAAGAGTFTLSVHNSYITKFQKTAILVWGPTLTVDITGNTIQGYGQTLFSTGNGIQIASSDRSSLGGANGDRRGTTGVVRNNQILDIGLGIPAPGEEGSYLNLGLYGPTCVLLYQAGSGIEISGNTITRSTYRSWYNDFLSNDGGFSNAAINAQYSSNVRVFGNTISGFDAGITEMAANNGSQFVAYNNTVSKNLHDYFTSSTNDSLYLSSGAETVGYYTGYSGTDVISGFGVGDKINVIGFASGSVNGALNGTLLVDFTGGSVSYGNGSTVAGKSVQVRNDASGYTMLYLDTDNTADAAEDSIMLAGYYSKGNFTLLDGSIYYAVTQAPSVTTVTADSIFSAGIRFNADVTSDGGDTVTTRSILISATNNNPHLGDGDVADSTVTPGTGTYAVKATGLSFNTTYYYRAYAINAVDTSYGTVLTATTACDGATEGSLALNEDQSSISIDGTGKYLATTANCRTLALVSPSGGNPVSGGVNGKVWVRNTVPSYNGKPFVPRSYEITPVNNAATATATVTLYFTQADFDLYNTSYNGEDLPYDSTDAEGLKSNARVYKFGGTSSDNSGMPDSYTQPGTVITPSSVSWNSAMQRWEIAFSTTGFSGFFLGNTTQVLPVQLTSFTGKNTTVGNELYWATAAEVNAKEMQLERSADGNHFATIATLPAKGKAATYQYTDKKAIGVQYYRLKLVDKDGTAVYSQVIKLATTNSLLSMQLYPNPASRQLYINSNAKSATITIYNVTGAVMLQQNWKPGQVMNIAQLPAGTYIVELTELQHTIRERIVKQ